MGPVSRNGAAGGYEILKGNPMLQGPVCDRMGLICDRGAETGVCSPAFEPGDLGLGRWNRFRARDFDFDREPRCSRLHGAPESEQRWE